MLQVQKMQLQQGKVNTLLKTGLQELKKSFLSYLNFTIVSYNTKINLA